ncbi:MAG: hypothetical protein SOZ23_01350 [Methanosphaera sp.]|uniref:hypothetical protein n=1 Tax=Methanosphaera sp. TaxID=2666342 RepID=UPI0025EB75FD|nr:hypothetical protein [Methanosphaera sp.]MCI5866519.1 hypothetical protein [Methanosphaera sp.]MDD6534990.1 hypothetical protein [Methanosphaera sp.]MDY3955423.1 hypothetical protein [Methanosphaera sp.]
MISKDNTKKYASSVLISTIEELFDYKENTIDAFFDDFVETYKKDKKLKKDYKDNEVVDEYLITELEKSFTQNDIGRVLQKQMVEANNEAIEDLAGVVDEKLMPVRAALITALGSQQNYDVFKKYVTENIVMTNLNLSTATIKALKTMNISGMKAAEIMQLISQVDY